ASPRSHPRSRRTKYPGTLGRSPSRQKTRVDCIGVGLHCIADCLDLAQRERRTAVVASTPSNEPRIGISIHAAEGTENAGRQCCGGESLRKDQRRAPAGDLPELDVGSVLLGEPYPDV